MSDHMKAFVARCIKPLVMDDGETAPYTVGDEYQFEACRLHTAGDDCDYMTLDNKQDQHWFGALDCTNEQGFCSGHYFEFVKYIED